MTYNNFILELFKQDQSEQGIQHNEIMTVIENSNLNIIENFLIHNGYNLKNMYANTCA